MRSNLEKRKKQNRRVVCTKSPIPWVNQAPSGWVSLPLHHSFQSPACCPLSQALCTRCCVLLEYSTQGSWQPYPCSSLRSQLHCSLSGRLSLTHRPMLLSSESLLFPFIVLHPMWNYMSTCLHGFLLSWLDCKLLKSRDHVCSDSPLQSHYPAQGLTHVQMSGNNGEEEKRIWESLENKGSAIICNHDLLVLFPVSIPHLLPMVYEEFAKQWCKSMLMQTFMFASCIQRT